MLLSLRQDICHLFRKGRGGLGQPRGSNGAEQVLEPGSFHGLSGASRRGAAVAGAGAGRALPAPHG